MSLTIKLKMLGACQKARGWAEEYGINDEQLAWNQCDKPQWLMWALAATSLPGSDRRIEIAQFLKELSDEAWEEEMDQNEESFCDLDSDDAAGMAHDFISEVIIHRGYSKQECLNAIRARWPNPPTI